MYIPKVNFIIFNNKYKSKVQKDTLSNTNSASDFNTYCYCPIHNNKINFQSSQYLNKTVIKNSKALQNSLETLLTPMKKDFITMKKGAIVDYFNQFHELEYGKMAMAVEPDFKFVFKGFAERDLKGEQFSIRVIDLKNGEFDFGFFDEKNNLQRIKLKNNQLYSLEDLKNPLSYAKTIALEDKFNEMLPTINQGIEKINNIIDGVFRNDRKGYAMFLTRGIKKRFKATNEFLNKIETEKRYALKRSYPKFIPFPNKTAFFFKENEKIFAERIAFVPHREGEEKLFRIVKFDSESNIQDAYLIDTDKGGFKNFCKRKIFNQKNISIIPKDDTKMTSTEISETELIPMLEKYYFMIDEFSEYVQKNASKSAKILLENAKSKDYLPYNMIRQNFIDRLKFVLPESKTELKFINSKNQEYILKKTEVEGHKVIQISRNCEKGNISVFLDEKNCRILDIKSDGKLIFDQQGKIKKIPHSSDAFKIRSRILQEFINEAFEQENFIKDENLINILNELSEQFTKTSLEWSSAYKNKKTEARKLFGDSFIAAKGDIGGFRFAIPEREYSIGLKPHQVGKDRFMRLTVYNPNGEIIENFLLENFSKIVDNYCAQGKFTKDAISRTPENIVYKTDEQIQATNLKEYLNEYLTELKRFEKFFSEYMNKNHEFF